MKKLINTAYICFLTGITVSMILSMWLSVDLRTYKTMTGHEYVFNQRLALYGDCVALQNLITYENQHRSEISIFLKKAYEEDFEKKCKVSIKTSS